MADLPAPLRERLSRLDVGLLRGGPRADEAVRLACDLLVAGVATPAVVDLAGASPTRLTAGDAVPAVRRMLAELGFAPVDLDQPPWAVARDIGRRVIGGTLPPEVGAGHLFAMWAECGHPDEIGLLILSLDEWHDTLCADEAIRAELRDHAWKVVLASEARLAGG